MPPDKSIQLSIARLAQSPKRRLENRINNHLSFVISISTSTTGQLLVSSGQLLAGVTGRAERNLPFDTTIKNTDTLHYDRQRMLRTYCSLRNYALIYRPE